MNYEEKYKEMKKRVLAIGQGYVKEVDYSSPRSIAEYIDPELRESEDERIRKEIIEYITLYKDSLCESEYKSWIAWLEKQGEQKPAWSKEDEEQVIFFEKLLEFAYNKDPHGLGTMCVCGKVWLKSLKDRIQPQLRWKPSEEQLNSLGRFIEGVYGCVDFTNIQSLYEELLKL